MNNNQREISEIKQEKMKNKKIIVILIVLVLVLLVFIFGISMYFIKSSEINRTNYSNNTNASNSSTDENKLDTTEKIDFQTTIDDNNVDFSNYKVDEDINVLTKVIESNLDVVGSNILDLARNRLDYVALTLTYNREFKTTTDPVIQPAAYVEKQVFADKFKVIYGNNYDFESTANQYSGPEFSYCTSHQSVNDGNHVCWNNARNGAQSTFLFVALKKSVGDEYIISGRYYTLATPDSIDSKGNFELKYSYDGSNKYIKSAVITKE